MKKPLKIVLVAAIGIVIIIGLASTLLPFATKPQTVEFDTSLNELTQGVDVVLVHMRTAGNSDEVGIENGQYIVSTDGTVQQHTSGHAYERLSDQSILVSDEQDSGTTIVRVETTETTVFPVAENDISHLSIAPTGSFIAYAHKDGTCISELSDETIGECVSPYTNIDETQNNEGSFFDSEWKKEDDLYIIRVRSTEEHEEVDSGIENTPPLRVQNEIARYEYNPATNELTEMSLDDGIELKTEVEGSSAILSRLGYDLVFSQGSNEIGIEDAKTEKKAKLMDAPFFGTMTGFDIL